MHFELNETENKKLLALFEQHEKPNKNSLNKF